MNSKDKALKQVRDNNRLEYEKLLAFAKNWVSKKMYPFTSEDVKLAYEAENEPPRQPNIYGALMNAMASKKLIYESGHDRAKLPAAHGRIILTWLSHEYRVAQSEKPKNHQQITLLL